MGFNRVTKSHGIQHIMGPKKPQNGVNSFSLDLGKIEFVFVVLEILVDILQGGMDRRSWMLVNFVPPIGVGSEEPREVLLEGGDDGGNVGYVHK